MNISKAAVNAASVLSFSVFAIAITGCGSFFPQTANLKSPVGAAVVGDNGSEAISVSAATVAQCANGGSVYSVFIDSNANGVLDSGESVLSTQVVCNGANGASGLTTLFLLNRVTTDAATCPALAGLQISSGLDLNQDQILESNEITQTQMVCDGQNGQNGQNGQDGQNGANGTNGSNGANAVFQMVPADAAICPAGGTTILMALDTAGTGLYAPSDANQQSTTICNGSNGLDAAPSPYTPVQVLTPCGSTVSNKEVLLVLQNGQVLADESDSSSGTNTRLAFLTDGNYTDTDGSTCNFSIATSSDGSSRSASWLGQVQATWSVNP